MTEDHVTAIIIAIIIGLPGVVAAIASLADLRVTALLRHDARRAELANHRQAVAQRLNHSTVADHFAEIRRLLQVLEDRPASNGPTSGGSGGSAP